MAVAGQISGSADERPAGSGDVELDLSAWPVAVVVLPERVSDAAMRRYLEQLHVLLERRTSFALVIDTSGCDGLSAAQRKMITDHMARDADAVSSYCRGMAMVFTSVIMRGVYTALQWVRRPPCPDRAFADRPAAVAWARQQLGRS